MGESLLDQQGWLTDLNLSIHLKPLKRSGLLGKVEEVEEERQ